MSLPPELLRQVFMEALRVGEEIDPWNHSHQQLSGLLLLNKNTSAEASRIFYGENCFDLRVFGTPQAASFFRAIGSNAGKIKQVHIDINVCPATHQLDEDSRLTAELLRKSCENLRTVIVSLRMPDGLHAEDASRLRSATRDLFDEKIAIHHASNGNAETAIAETEHARARKAVLDGYSDTEKSRDYCRHPSGTCGKHPHVLDWISNNAWFSIFSHRQVCLGLLHDAQKVKQARLPDCSRTIISANGKLRHVEWKDFAMNIFHEPWPTNALQATLAMVLSDMKFYTITKNGNWVSKKPGPSCRQVYSRRDIYATFPSARDLSFTEMCQKIHLIRILDYIKEREEDREDEEKMAEKEAKEKKRAGRRKRARASGQLAAVKGCSAEKEVIRRDMDRL